MLVVVSTTEPRHGRRDVAGFEHHRARAVRPACPVSRTASRLDPVSYQAKAQRRGATEAPAHRLATVVLVFTDIDSPDLGLVLIAGSSWYSL